jgi:hypothetical protein
MDARAKADEMEMEKSVIDRISSLRGLPSLPHIIVKLMEACKDEKAAWETLLIF